MTSVRRDNAECPKVIQCGTSASSMGVWALKPVRCYDEWVACEEVTTLAHVRDASRFASSYTTLVPLSKKRKVQSIMWLC